MQFVEFSVEGSVALIRLNRPPVNALSAALSLELAEAFGLAGDESVRAVVLTGEPHFAAGADIKDFQAHYDTGRQTAHDIPLRDAIRTLELLPKPVVAAVRGYALGGGLELAMGADFRYLTEDALVGQPEIKLGLIPGAGGTQRLTRLVGVAKARDIVYSGRFVSAREALEIGLADKVVGPEGLLELALEDARAWAEGPTKALAAAKRAINEGWGLPIEDGLAIERVAFDQVFWTEDARAGVAGFIAKSEPRFEGR
ncbi:MAG TPA: enoyl-CoA hydratase/isomerase family protein [Acidimicrobiia bacterium]